MNWSESLGMEKPRQRRWSQPVPVHPLRDKGDGFAPFRGAVCYDANRYGRAEHAFVVSKRDGMHCVWCDALERAS